MTKYIPVTTVIPPGTVVIRHNLAEVRKVNKVPIIAGVLGGMCFYLSASPVYQLVFTGVAALILLGIFVYFILRRHRRREQPEVDLSIGSPEPIRSRYPGLPPSMSEVQDHAQGPIVGGSSTGYGGVVAANQHAAPTRYHSATPTSVDVTFSGGSSSMYASTSNLPNPSAIPMGVTHTRTPSAASGEASVHQTPSASSLFQPNRRGGVGIATTSANMGMVHEEDGGPFADSNRVPTPQGVFVHEDGGSIRDLDVRGGGTPPQYRYGSSSRF